MSDKYNDVWLEDANMHFEEAIETEQWAMARAVIGDLKEGGFADSAVVLERRLRNILNPDKE
jgi:hypothetical protein